MHGSHPSLQANAILLHFLHRLAFGCVWRLDSKFHDQLRPGFDLLGIKLFDQFEQTEDLEVFIVALGRRLKIRPKCSRICIESYLWIAVQNERHIRVRHRLSRYIL